jgi:hypothetical protein
MVIEFQAFYICWLPLPCLLIIRPGLTVSRSFQLSEAGLHLDTVSPDLAPLPGREINLVRKSKEILMQTQQATRIAGLNDAFRRGGFGVLLTPEVVIIGDEAEIMRAVREFNEFTCDNDPYGEHDFGSIDWDGQKLFWKIDYYDENMKYGAHPLSSKCRRVLTIMDASEY